MVKLNDEFNSKTTNEFKSCFNINQLKTVGNSKKTLLLFLFSFVVQFRTKTKKDANEVKIVSKNFSKIVFSHLFLKLPIVCVGIQLRFPFSGGRRKWFGGGSKTKTYPFRVKELSKKKSKKKQFELTQRSFEFLRRCERRRKKEHTK